MFGLAKESVILYLLDNLLILILFSINANFNFSSIRIKENSIIIRSIRGNKNISYINRRKPEISFFDQGLEIAEYDLPYVVANNRGIIIVREIIPYEGIYSSVRILDSKGNLLKILPKNPCFISIAPDSNFFAVIEESHGDFSGLIYIYDYKGNLIKYHYFSESGPAAGNLTFDSKSRMFLMHNSGGIEGIPCEYLIYNNEHKEINIAQLPNCYCNKEGNVNILFTNSHIIIGNNSNYQLYIFSLEGNLIINSNIDGAEYSNLVNLIDNKIDSIVKNNKLIIKSHKWRHLIVELK